MADTALLTPLEPVIRASIADDVQLADALQAARDQVFAARRSPRSRRQTDLVLGLIVNVLFFQVSPMALWGALDVVMIILPVCAFKAKSRKAYSTITLIYVPISALDVAITLTS